VVWFSSRNDTVTGQSYELGSILRFWRPLFYWSTGIIIGNTTP